MANPLDNVLEAFGRCIESLLEEIQARYPQAEIKQYPSLEKEYLLECEEIIEYRNALAALQEYERDIGKDNAIIAMHNRIIDLTQTLRIVLQEIDYDQKYTVIYNGAERILMREVPQPPKEQSDE